MIFASDNPVSQPPEVGSPAGQPIEWEDRAVSGSSQGPGDRHARESAGQRKVTEVLSHVDVRCFGKQWCSLSGSSAQRISPVPHKVICRVHQPCPVIQAWRPPFSQDACPSAWIACNRLRTAKINLRLFLSEGFHKRFIAWIGSSSRRNA